MKNSHSVRWYACNIQEERAWQSLKSVATEIYTFNNVQEVFIQHTVNCCY